MSIRNLFPYVLAGLLVAGSGVAARAQFPRPVYPGGYPLPSGPVAPWPGLLPPTPALPGNVIIHPSATQPGAQFVIPGTQSSFSQFVPGVGWVSGNRYLGLDGQWHGQTIIPNGNGSNDVHVYSSLRPTTNSQPRAAGVPYRLPR